MPTGIWVKDMPGFEDWVELHRPEMSEREARSYGEVHLSLESTARVTRKMTFEVLELTVTWRREHPLELRGHRPAPSRSADHLPAAEDDATQR